MFSTASTTPYSLLNHRLVDRSMSAMLMRFPCLLQNSSKALSVTNVSTSFSWPSEISFCTSAISIFRIFAALFQEHAPRANLPASLVTVADCGSTPGACFAQPCCDGFCGDTRIANSQRATRNKLPQSRRGSYAVISAKHAATSRQSLLRSCQAPPVGSERRAPNVQAAQRSH